jgi:hypothetical protein
MGDRDDLERWRKFAAQAGMIGILGLLDELAQLRERAEGTWTVMGEWAGDAVVPSGYHVFGADGQTGPDIDIDACELVAEVLRRQALAWCRQHSEGDGPELGALLSLVPGDRELIVTIAEHGFRAGWWRCSLVPLASAFGSSIEAAIRAATLQLLELPTGPSCGTCEHWQREAEPVLGARPCARDPEQPPRTAESSCPGYEPIGGPS